MGTPGIHKEIERCQTFRAVVSLNGRIVLAYHEEMAQAVQNCGAAFTVRSIQSIKRRWPGADGRTVLYVPH